jgi:hypothetical protein
VEGPARPTVDGWSLFAHPRISSGLRFGAWRGRDSSFSLDPSPLTLLFFFFFYYYSLSPLKYQMSIPTLIAKRMPKKAAPYRLIPTTAIATMANVSSAKRVSSAPASA